MFQVFNNELADPTVYDSSMTADMEMIQKSLQNDFEENEDDGIEFF